MSNCPFCNHTPSSLWLESASALALWDGFPISEGHTLVVPRCHAASLFDLPASELSFIHVPTGLASRFLRVPSAPGAHAFVMLEDVVRHHLSRLFLGYTVKSCHAIRVTRDSDLPVE